jgi:EAL domain-containing protein (putative c-di-GMP-specific phosphodiesterase class I)/GGDEF domain-containing protein/PAS domain-containing protein
MTPVRLLIAESSERAAERFDSILRDAGIATRIQLVELPTAGEALTRADLMLCNAELPQIERMLPQLRSRAPDVPIILVDHRQTTMKPVQGLRIGASDVVAGADTEQLVLVFQRELENVTRSRRVHQLNTALEEAEQRCELLLQSSEAAIAYVHEGMHIHANDTYLRLFGFGDAEEVLGLPLMDLLCETSAETLDFRGRTHDGRQVVGRMTLAAAQYEGEPCVQVAVKGVAPALTVHRSSDIAAAASRAANPAHANGTTADHAPPAAEPVAAHRETANGSPYVSISGFLAAATQLVAKPEPCIALLVVQVDQFARLQTEQGLRNGELIGGEVQRILESNLAGNPVFRLAPQQYAVVTLHEDRASVRALAEHLRTRIRGTPVTVSGGTVGVRVTIGAALLDSGGQAPDAPRLEAALDLAFAAVARLSEDGGDKLELVGGRIDDPAEETPSGRLLAEINKAIDQEAFALLFQPIISLRGDTSEHYEVFLRMLDADGTLVRPDAFLATAAEHGVAGKIDRWVILRAIKALLAQRAAGHNTRLTVSVTGNSIADPEFAPWLGVALKAARLPSDALIFQVSEHDVMAMVRQAQAFVQALRAMHCQASIARFGTSDAPFERLKNIAADYVKLDGRLIERMNTDPNGRERVADMLNRLQQLGKLSVIPKVETASMLAVLWQAGANFVQGDYLQVAGPEMNFDFSTAE